MTSKFFSKKTITVIFILTAIASLIIAGESIRSVTSYREANAQLSSPQNTAGATTYGAKNAGNQNITGSIKLKSIIGNAIASQIKVSLVRAAMSAEQDIGNNSHAVAANLGQESGFLVYTVWVVDSNYNFHKIVVDAGNGKVLASQNMSVLRNMNGPGGSPLISPPSGPITGIP
jgi:uncharacterized membrane protein YkoI